MNREIRMNRCGTPSGGVAAGGGIKAEYESGHLSLGEHFLEETQHLWHVQLNVLEVKEMLVVLLLNGRTGIINGKGIGAILMVTNLLQQVVDVEIHLKNRLFPAFIMQCDYKRSRCR